MRIGTVELKVNGMRKAQRCVVYPRSDDSEPFQIQGDTYIARVDPNTGKGKIAGPYASGAYLHHLSPLFSQKIKGLELSPEQLQAVKDAEAKKGQEIGPSVTVG